MASKNQPSTTQGWPDLLEEPSFSPLSQSGHCHSPPIESLLNGAVHHLCRDDGRLSRRWEHYADHHVAVKRQLYSPLKCPLQLSAISSPLSRAPCRVFGPALLVPDTEPRSPMSLLVTVENNSALCLLFYVAHFYDTQSSLLRFWLHRRVVHLWYCWDCNITMTHFSPLLFCFFFSPLFYCHPKAIIMEVRWK